jgi:hypothetical protein
MALMRLCRIVGARPVNRKQEMRHPKDWTVQVVRRFKDGETVAELAMAFQTLKVSDIEGIIRRAMQAQERAS